MWRNISKPLYSQDIHANVLSSGMGYSLSDGSKIRFWHDNWIINVAPKSAFPRIFALSVNKDGKVQEFGSGNKYSWSWKMAVRRRLFGWEIQQWNDLCSILKESAVCHNLKDPLIWKGSTSGLYSVKKYCKSMTNFYSMNMDSNIWKFVWMGLAPPKVEIFCWQMIRGRITVKDLLVKRGMMEWNMTGCTFCKADIELVEHLFFSCNFSWTIGCTIILYGVYIG
ncbi:hypothetical protein CRYUN_Cryun36dG0024100 [Craigia yunnanensis]